MYQIELLTLTDKIRKKNPVIMPNVRTVSVSSARILVTDDHDHITLLDPEINTNHAQLIFTSHDSWQLNGNILRRDEIWFTEKDKNGISYLFSLADFVDEDGVKIRKDENYEKNYLLGKYGAIPTLKHFDMFKGE